MLPLLLVLPPPPLAATITATTTLMARRRRRRQLLPLLPLSLLAAHHTMARLLQLQMCLSSCCLGVATFLMSSEVRALLHCCNNLRVFGQQGSCALFRIGPFSFSGVGMGWQGMDSEQDRMAEVDTLLLTQKQKHRPPHLDWLSHCSLEATRTSRTLTSARRCSSVRGQDCMLQHQRPLSDDAQSAASGHA